MAVCPATSKAPRRFDLCALTRPRRHRAWHMEGGQGCCLVARARRGMSRRGDRQGIWDRSSQLLGAHGGRRAFRLLRCETRRKQSAAENKDARIYFRSAYLEPGCCAPEEAIGRSAAVLPGWWTKASRIQCLVPGWVA